MKNGLTKRQIQWASEHDWFLGTKDGLVLVLDQQTEMCNGILTLCQNQKTFNNFQALRDWAGY